MVYYLVRVKGELWNKTVRIMVKTSHQFRWLSGKFCASIQSDYTRWAWACFSAKTKENVSIKIEFNIPGGLVGDTNMDIFPLFRRPWRHVKTLLLVFMWRHGGHVGVQNNSEKSLLGLCLYYYAKLERRFAIVLYPNMAVSSREWKPRIANFRVASVYFRLSLKRILVRNLLKETNVVFSCNSKSSLFQ